MIKVEFFTKQAKTLELQAILEQYYKVTGLACLIKLKGYDKTLGAGRRNLCRLFHNDPTYDTGYCMQLEALDDHFETTCFKRFNCPNGLVECAKPLVVDEQIIGYAYIGQILFEEPNREFLSLQAQALNRPLAEVESLYAAIPHMSPDKFYEHQQIMEVLINQWLNFIESEYHHFVENKGLKDHVIKNKMRLTEELHLKGIYESALEYIATAYVEHDRKTFFIEAAEFLKSLLKVDQVVIGEFINQSSVKTWAFLQDDVVRPSITYSLEGTPCETVINKEFRLYNTNVCECFPDDLALIQKGLVSYAGHPMWRLDGIPLGLIAVFSRQALKYQEVIEQVLKVFSLRVASEISGAQHADQMAKHQALLEKKVSDRTEELTQINEELIATLDELQLMQKKMVQNEKQQVLTTLIKGLNERLNIPLGNLYMGYSMFDNLVEQIRERVSLVIDEESAEGLNYTHHLMRRSIDQLIEVNALIREIMSTYQEESCMKVNLREAMIASLNTFTVDGMSDQLVAQLDISDGVHIKTYPKAIDVMFKQMLSFTKANTHADQKPKISFDCSEVEDNILCHYKDFNDYKHMDIHRLFEPLSLHDTVMGVTGFEMHMVYSIITEKLGGQVKASLSHDGHLEVEFMLPYCTN